MPHFWKAIQVVLSTSFALFFPTMRENVTASSFQHLGLCFLFFSPLDAPSGREMFFTHFQNSTDLEQSGFVLSSLAKFKSQIEEMQNFAMRAGCNSYVLLVQI